MNDNNEKGYERVRAAIDVVAGVLPGEPIPEYTKQFIYLEREFEEDKLLPEDQNTRFCEVRDEAMEYAKQIQNPAYVNWVKWEWVWF